MRMLLLFLLCTTAYADSIVECVDRGRIALDVAHALDEGMTVEQINFAFPHAKPEEIPAAEQWGEALKAEVEAELKLTHNAEQAAQKVMERCAYEYGKNYHKTSLESDTKVGYCWQYIHTLKRLYVAIKQSSTEEVIAQHPPSEEGADLAYARRIGAEIEADDHPSAFLEKYWKACMENPEGVGK